MGELEIKKSGVTSQLGEQNIIDNIVDLKANIPLLLSLPSSTESGSNTSLLLSQNSPSTSTMSSTVTRNTELLLSSQSRPLSQPRGLSSQTSTDNPTEQSTAMKKPVHNKEKKTSSTLGLSIVSS